MTKEQALKRIAAYPFSRAEELSVEQMREIAREALQSNEQDLSEQGRNRSAVLGNNVEAMMDAGLPFLKALETTLKVYDHDVPKVGCVNHDCDKCKAQPEQEPVAKKMTAHRAVYFMERFKHEEKLLGPNEQAALDFVIALLEAHQEQEPVAMKFKIYKPTAPDPVRQGINNALLPWVYDQDRSSGFDASMWVTPVATLPPQRKPLTDAPEIAQRVMRFAGKTMRTARNPNITARECIELANWLAAHGITAAKGEDL